MTKKKMINLQTKKNVLINGDIAMGFDSEASSSAPLAIEAGLAASLTVSVTGIVVRGLYLLFRLFKKRSTINKEQITKFENKKEKRKLEKNKTYFIFLIILFSILFSQTNQYSLQTKETNETLVARYIDYKEDKPSIKYDKKFDYMNQKFNNSPQNLLNMKILAVFKLSFNPFQKDSKKEILNKNSNTFKLRYLENENFVLVYINLQFDGLYISHYYENIQDSLKPNAIYIDGVQLNEINYDYQHTTAGAHTIKLV